MSIITVSHQYGSHGKEIAETTAATLGFRLVTPEEIDGIVHDRYQLDYSLSGEIGQTPKDSQRGKIFASLISAVLTDMAVLNDLVVLECGGQFVFRSFPNALHIRIVAPRDVRAHNVMQRESLSFEEALKRMDEQYRKTARFLRSTFRRPSESPERYDVVINSGTVNVQQAVDLILRLTEIRKLTEYGMVSNETARRARLRNQIRLVRSLTRLSMERNQPLAQFAHPSELVFARLLDFYGIRWEYEPRTFALSHDREGNIREAFSPDFYLPDSDLYVELTTMKQSLVTKKNRKVRKLRQLYPGIKIRLLYQKDFEDLLFKYASEEQPKE